MENLVGMFGNVYKDKKVLITGHTGFKGSWLSIWLQQLGAVVSGVSVDVPTVPSIFNDLQLSDLIDHHVADIRDLSALRTIVDKVNPDFVFHLAAQPIVVKSYADPLETISTNIMGTAHVLECLRFMKKPCQAVIITSDKCYDNVEWSWGYRETDALGGKDPYSASKGGAELIVKTYYHSFFAGSKSPVRLVSVRAGNVIGGGDWAPNRIIPDCVRAWTSGKPVELRNPNSTRPWQHVLEPLSGYLRCGQLLAETPEQIHGEAFNFGPNADQKYTVLEVLKEIRKHWPSLEMSEFFVIQNTNQLHEAGLLKLNWDKALHALQWKPVLNFEQTALLTAEWYVSFYAQKTPMVELTRGQIQQYAGWAKEKKLPWIM